MSMTRVLLVSTNFINWLEACVLNVFLLSNFLAEFSYCYFGNVNFWVCVKTMSSSWFSEVYCYSIADSNLLFVIFFWLLFSMFVNRSNESEDALIIFSLIALKLISFIWTVLFLFIVDWFDLLWKTSSVSKLDWILTVSLEFGLYS